MKPAYLNFIFLLLFVQPMKAQEVFGIEEMNKPIGAADLRYNVVFRGSVFFSWNAGFGLSLAVGGWIRNNYIQGSSNLSVNYFLGKYAMGNRYNISGFFNKSNSLLMVNYSNFLTLKLGPQVNWYYEEINPLYFGSNTGVFNSFKHAFTVGTTTVALPKGTYNNITSPRNRSQQLVFFQIKVGGTETTSNEATMNSFQVNIVEDFFGNFVAPFADLRDRFFTGGGSLAIRFADRYVLKYFTETYTGNSYVDKQDYPDLVLLDQNRWAILPKNKKLPRVYAYQDIGQIALNTARNFGVLSYTPKGSLNAGAVQVFIGTTGGNGNAWTQHLIHNCVGINKNQKVFSDGNKGLKSEKLHHFKYDHRPAKLMFGFNFENYRR